MKEAPLKLINPLSLARQGAELKGSLALATMGSLAPLLSRAEGEAGYQLEFSQRKGDPRVFIDGSISAELLLLCQRCGQEFQESITTETHLQAVLNDAQAAKVEAPYEPLLMDEDHCIRLVDLIQEEIVLALPMFARHPEGECIEKEL